MTNTPAKRQVTQDSANTTKNKQENCSFKGQKNAYRLDSILCQIDDFDAIADGDWWKVQGSYRSLNGATLETVDADDFIFQVGQDFKMLGTNGSCEIDRRAIAEKGIRFPVNKFIVKEEWHINFDTNGQDAAEELHYELEGQYVKISEEAKKKLLNTTTL